MRAAAPVSHNNWQQKSTGGTVCWENRAPFDCHTRLPSQIIWLDAGLGWVYKRAVILLLTISADLPINEAFSGSFASSFLLSQMGRRGFAWKDWRYLVTL